MTIRPWSTLAILLALVAARALAAGLALPPVTNDEPEATTPAPVPMAALPTRGPLPLYPTVPCVIGGSAALTFIRFGGALDFAIQAPECDLREWLRMADVIGLDKYTRKQLACQSKALSLTAWCMDNEPEPVTITIEKPVEVIRYITVPGPVDYQCPIKTKPRKR